MEVTLMDTALGRQQARMMKQLIFSAGVSLLDKDFNHLVELLWRRK